MEYQRWLKKLLGFVFEIQYKPRLENKAADALSRKGVVVEMFALTVPAAIQLEKIGTEVDQNQELQQIIKALQEGSKDHEDYSLVQGRLLRKGKLIIPWGSKIIEIILQEFHNGKMGGHGGVLKTQRRIGDLFFWPGMMTDIRKYLAACTTCQRQKYLTLAPGGLLQPLPTPTNIWEDISMDFIEGLPKSEGMSSILVVVDRLSKYSHLFRLKHPFTVVSVVELLVKEIVKLHGFPKTVISDRDKVFMSQFWKELFKLAGTKLCFSTGYHPQSNG